MHKPSLHRFLLLPFVRDVLCGFLFCANVTLKPKFGDLQGEVTSFTLYHQNKYLDCR